MIREEAMGKHTFINIGGDQFDGFVGGIGFNCHHLAEGIVIEDIPTNAYLA